VADADIIVSIVSVFSLFASIIAIFISRKAHREAITVQRRIVEIEEQRERDRQLSELKASLHPRLRKTDRGLYRLHVVNSGKGLARNVRVTLDGKRLVEHGTAVQGGEIPALIGPNSEVSCLLVITLGCAPPFKIEVEWDDESGKDRIFQGTLTL